MNLFLCAFVYCQLHAIVKCSLFLLGIRCGRENISGSGTKLNCAARVGSDDLGYGPGSGFNFKPVQTSIRAVSDPLPEPPALLQQNPFESF